MSDTESNGDEERKKNDEKAKKVKLDEEEEDENVEGVEGMTDFLLYFKPKSFSESSGNALYVFFSLPCFCLSVRLRLRKKGNFGFH